MAQRTSQGVKDGGSALPSGTAQPALARAEALGRRNPDQRAPSPALAKEDVLYATRPKPPAQLIRATRSRHSLEHMLDRSVAPAPPSQILRFQFDQRVLAQVFLPRILWLQGFPEQATRMAHSSVEDTQAIGHALSLCIALADTA